MEEENSKVRYFLIEHEKKNCGAVFTINSERSSNVLICPHCNRDLITKANNNIQKFHGFFKEYDYITNDLLKPNEATIREIQPEELEAIKSPPKPSK